MLSPQQSANEKHNRTLTSVIIAAMIGLVLLGAATYTSQQEDETPSKAMLLLNKRSPQTSSRHPFFPGKIGKDDHIPGYLVTIMTRVNAKAVCTVPAKHFSVSPTDGSIVFGANPTANPDAAQWKLFAEHEGYQYYYKFENARTGDFLAYTSVKGLHMINITDPVNTHVEEALWLPRMAHGGSQFVSFADDRYYLQDGQGCDVFQMTNLGQL